MVLENIVMIDYDVKDQNVIRREGGGEEGVGQRWTRGFISDIWWMDGEWR